MIMVVATSLVELSNYRGLEGNVEACPLAELIERKIQLKGV
jgi:hypothetical protein